MKIHFSLILLLLSGIAWIPLHAEVVGDQPVTDNQQDPLPSWNDTAPKQDILAFVARVTSKEHVDFVPESERIAVFDNDGTLWAEAPIPFQAAFAFDELKRRAPQEPDLAADSMVQAALAGDIGKLLAGKHHDGLFRVLGLTHAGMTTDQFDRRVKNWLASARHPRFNKPYTDLTYQPMLEYTTIGNPHPSFGLIVHHTDADREYAYDANPKGSGKLTTALSDAPKRGWTVVDMKEDWKMIWSN